MKFTKMQGAGNDYIYIDARGVDKDWSSLSRLMSDRHFGVGGDGIILVLESDIADLKMRMFNSDGSEGEMCGNGIRCFAKYALDRGIVTHTDAGLTIETLAGVRTVTPTFHLGNVAGARVSMGLPLLNPVEIPVILDQDTDPAPAAVTGYPLTIEGTPLDLTFVSMGNPHAVSFLSEPVAEYPLHTIGPKVEHHPIFPNRVNFEVVNLNQDGRATARVWERGSGETMACGTGACAIAVASRLEGRHEGPLDITLPGGTLTIEWDGKGEVYMEGPAEEVFSGEWPL